MPDRLAQFVDAAFNDPHHQPAITLLIGAFFFSFQIFCDFSGYSDIAIGAAEVMGFKLMQNFNSPYHARSISEFWKRWHISLSSWFRDYLYISLGGNRVSIPRWYFNLFFVFLVSGFWHGANWTFILWGALHGFYLIFAIVTEKSRNWLRMFTGISKVAWLDALLQTLICFILVTIAWILFRANTTADAFYIIRQLPHGLREVMQFAKTGHTWLGRSAVFNNRQSMVIAFILIFFLEAVHWVQTKISILQVLAAQPAYVRWAVYNEVIVSIWLLGVFENRQFIYFQF